VYLGFEVQVVVCDAEMGAHAVCGFADFLESVRYYVRKCWSVV
jgi:hypothetical protein